MPSHSHDAIRRLLKEFGLTADEAVTAYLIETRPAKPLQLRITLEDLTPYDCPPPRLLRVQVEGEISV